MTIFNIGSIGVPGSISDVSQGADASARVSRAIQAAEQVEAEYEAMYPSRKFAKAVSGGMAMVTDRNVNPWMPQFADLAMDPTWDYPALQEYAADYEFYKSWWDLMLDPAEAEAQGLINPGDGLAGVVWVFLTSQYKTLQYQGAALRDMIRRWGFSLVGFRFEDMIRPDGVNALVWRPANWDFLIGGWTWTGGSPTTVVKGTKTPVHIRMRDVTYSNPEWYETQPEVTVFRFLCERLYGETHGPDDDRNLWWAWLPGNSGISGETYEQALSHDWDTLQDVPDEVVETVTVG